MGQKLMEQRDIQTKKPLLVTVEIRFCITCQKSLSWNDKILFHVCSQLLRVQTWHPYLYLLQKKKRSKWVINRLVPRIFFILVSYRSANFNLGYQHSQRAAYSPFVCLCNQPPEECICCQLKNCPNTVLSYLVVISFLCVQLQLLPRKLNKREFLAGKSSFKHVALAFQGQKPVFSSHPLSLSQPLCHISLEAICRLAQLSVGIFWKCTAFAQCLMLIHQVTALSAF